MLGIQAARHGDPHLGATVAAVPRADRSSVRPCDRVDDRETEADSAVPARAVCACKALERHREDARLESGSLVGNGELDRVAAVGRTDGHCSGAVPQRVVDEVANGLREPAPIRTQLEGSAFDLDRSSLRDEAEPLRDLLQQLVGSEPRRLDAQRSSIRPRDDEQILRELHQPIGLLRGRAQRRLELLGRARLPERELELRLQDRERRPQLVARVGDELPLALEAGVEPHEHLVHGRAETTDLVVRLGERKAPTRARGRDLRRLATHRLHRSQRRACDEVPDDRRAEQREWQRDQKLREQRAERLVAILERLAGGNKDRAVLDIPHQQAGTVGLAVRSRHAALDDHRLFARRPSLSGGKHEAASLRVAGNTRGRAGDQRESVVLGQQAELVERRGAQERRDAITSTREPVADLLVE